MNYKNNNIFCDFLTVSQEHLTPHTPLYSGKNVYTDTETGEHTISYKFKSIDGYHLSNLQILSNGTKVQFSGNISRFNRSENFQGLNLDDCKKSINLLLISLGLPPFTNGETQQAQGKKNQSIIYTGAVISRNDMTLNLATGSPEKRDLYLDYLQTQTHKTLPKLLWEKNTYFGKQSDSRTIRIYDKAKHLRDVVLPKSDEPEYIKQLADTLDRNGVIRIETEYHRYLRTADLRYWHNATHKNMCHYFKQDLNIMTKKIIAKDFDGIDMPYLGTLLAYMSGVDIRKKISPRTFTTHKKYLQQFGYDISNKNIHALKPKHKTIILTVAEVPDFYKYPDKPWQLKSI